MALSHTDETPGRRAETSNPDPVYDRATAARYIGVSVSTLASDVSRPRLRIPFIRAGKKALYRQSDLEAFLARCRVDPRAAAPAAS